MFEFSHRRIIIASLERIGIHRREAKTNMLRARNAPSHSWNCISNLLSSLIQLSFSASNEREKWKRKKRKIGGEFL